MMAEETNLIYDFFSDKDQSNWHVSSGSEDEGAKSSKQKLRG